MKSTFKIFLLLLTAYCPLFTAHAQNTVRAITLDEAISMTQENSVNALKNRNNAMITELNFKIYRADHKPSIGISATIPNLNRSISAITLPDGTDAFISRSLANSSIGIQMHQVIPYTGTQIDFSSGLERIDIFDDTTNTSFLSNPYVISLRQPIFSYNAYRWDMKIKPLQHEEGQKKFSQGKEEVAIVAINIFFDLYLAQINYEMAEKNYKNNDTLYNITSGRYNIGTIGENELLQMELNLLNSQFILSNAKINLADTKFRFAKLTGLPYDTPFELSVPSDIPQLQVDYPFALQQALKNNPGVITRRIQQIQADQSVAQARYNSGFNANLFVSYGVSKSTKDLNDIYNDAQDEEMLVFGVELPIVGWGRARNQTSVAELNRDVTLKEIELATAQFEHDLLMMVERFNQQEDQMLIAGKSDAVAGKGYEIAKYRFMIGKIGITELNIAAEGKDRAKESYVSALKNYWLNYYGLRKETLYDFISGRELE